MRIMLAAFALLLVGCGQPTNTPAPDDVQVSNEEIYIQVIREAYPDLPVSDKLLLDYGKSVCGLFDAGGDAYDVMEIARKNDTSMELSATMTGAAVGALCPRNEDKLMR